MSGGAARNSTGTGHGVGRRERDRDRQRVGHRPDLPGAGNYFGPSRGRNLLSPDRPARGGVGPGRARASAAASPATSSIPLGAMAGSTPR